MKKISLVFSLLAFIAVTCKKENSHKPDTSYNPVISPVDFTKSTSLTNHYFQYQPGKKYISEGQTPDGFEHTEDSLLGETKQIMGITCVVVQDKVWLDGKPEELTYDWYAQDDSGNVWYFGEDVTSYNPDGSVKDHEGAWEAGVDGAKPGYAMLASPQPGDHYRQEYYFNVAEDEAVVVEQGLTVTVPYGTFQNCIKIKETTALEPDVVGYKYYAPGIGQVSEEEGGSVSKLISVQ
jgi:hypothetical protein